MTFDLSPEQLELRDAARAFARERVAAAASSIDERAEMPADLIGDAAALLARAGDAQAAALVTEELAASSASLALSVAAGLAGHELPGLRGSRLPGKGELDPRLRVLVGAVALGLGRAALDAAVEVFKRDGERPSGLTHERPHWVLADAATEMDAARLLLWQGAQTVADGAGEARIALAQTLAVSAAERAVAAALRVAGAEAYERGAQLERLSRDAKTLSFVGGTEEDHRLVAAQGFAD
ncbi:MAG: acyl-CoA dehydrogenase family protein [Vicinamibacterales bacterium]